MVTIKITMDNEGVIIVEREDETTELETMQEMLWSAHQAIINAIQERSFEA